MSTPGRRMDSPKGFGMDACASLCVPSTLVAPSFSRNAHMVDTHSCRPGFRPSHIVRFTGRSAQSLLAAESLSASPFCGPHTAVSVRERHGSFKRLRWRARAPIDAAVSSISPPVFLPPRRARSSRWIVCVCGCKSFSRRHPCEPPSWQPGPKTHRSQGEPCRVIEPW